MSFAINYHAEFGHEYSKDLIQKLESGILKKENFKLGDWYQTFTDKELRSFFDLVNAIWLQTKTIQNHKYEDILYCISHLVQLESNQACSREIEKISNHIASLAISSIMELEIRSGKIDSVGDLYLTRNDTISYRTK